MRLAFRAFRVRPGHALGHVVGLPLALLVASGAVGLLPRTVHGATPPAAEGESTAVATDNAEATKAAFEILGRGGNAADAAVAAALALGVVSPSASGIGGGGFALVYSAKDQKVTVLDFRETAPADYPAELLYPPNPPGTKADRSWKGPRGPAVGVPGEPAGLALLARRFGTRSLAEVAAPAVRLADGGFYLGRHTADMARMFKSRLETVPSLASALVPGGHPAPYASRVRRPDLARTLVRFGAEGPKSIYEGPTAQKIAAAVRAAGGTMTEKDLASYEVKERAPLVRTVDGRTIYTMPAPSAGGLMVLETLGMYGARSTAPLAQAGFGSSHYLHMVAEAMRGALADRARLAADPDLDPKTDTAYEAALDPTQLAARKAGIDPMKTRAPAEFKTREQGTSHLVVTDAQGNVVSLTTTVNGPFGAAIVPEGTGILLNNELDDFTAPGDLAAYGVSGSGSNGPRPRARPVSSMSPTLVVEAGRPILAVGGSGGFRIATAVTQATLARLLFDQDPVACVSHPRVHVSGQDLYVEKAVVPDVRLGLAARGESVKDEPFEGSAVQMVVWERPSGGRARVLAASDPRKAGFAAAR